MSFDGSGIYSPPNPPAFPAVSGNTISSTYFNQVINDIATALSTTICHDGQSVVSADIPFNAQRLIEVADPVDAQDGATKAYVDAEVLALSGFYASEIFADIATLAVPAAANFIVCADGTFAVTDSLANVTNAGLFPHFCVVDDAAVPRYWRVLAIDGLVPVRAGGAIGWNTEAEINYATNHRTVIAEALAYKAAVNAVGLSFDKAHYSIWCPERTYVSNNVNLDYTGIPFVITEPTVFQAADGGTAFHRRTYLGADPAVYAGTQILAQNAINNGNTMPWRGGMFLLSGPSAAPATYADRSALKLSGDWQLLGGLSISATPGLVTSGAPPYYTLNADGSGWDVTDKAIWCEQDRYTGDVVFDGNIKIDGFRGELIYQSGLYTGSIYQFGRLEFSNTDGGGFNPGPHWSANGNDGVIQCEHLLIHHAWNMLEGSGGKARSRIGYLEGYACNNYRGLVGGWFNEDPYTDSEFPVLTIDTLVLDCAGYDLPFQLSRFNQIGSATITDAGLQVGGTLSGPYNDTHNASIGTLRIIANTDNIGEGVLFTSGSATVGTLGTKKVTIGLLELERSAYAVANSKTIGYAARWGNSLGDGCFIKSIVGEATSGPQQASTTPDFNVGVGSFDVKYTLGSNAWNGETTPALSGGRVLYGLTNTTANANTTLTLPSAANYPVGSRIRLVSNTANAVFTISKSGTSSLRRWLLGSSVGVNYSMEWEKSESLWRLITAETEMTGSVTVNLQKGGADIPINDVSDETTFTVIGARAGMQVIVTPTTVISGDAQIVARISADNTVAIRAKNLNLVSTLAVGSATYNVVLSWPS